MWKKIKLRLYKFNIISLQVHYQLIGMQKSMMMSMLSNAVILKELETVNDLLKHR